MDMHHLKKCVDLSESQCPITAPTHVWPSKVNKANRHFLGAWQYTPSLSSSNMCSIAHSRCDKFLAVAGRAEKTPSGIKSLSSITGLCPVLLELMSFLILVLSFFLSFLIQETHSDRQHSPGFVEVRSTCQSRSVTDCSSP